MVFLYFLFLATPWLIQTALLVGIYRQLRKLNKLAEDAQ